MRKQTFVSSLTKKSIFSPFYSQDREYFFSAKILASPPCAESSLPHGATWVSGLGHFVQTWPDSECSHTVQFLDCSTTTFFSNGLCDIIIIII